MADIHLHQRFQKINKMPRFHLHELNDTEFEQLVVLICHELMGSGITSFAPGPDGGKDAKFEGMATAFPSTVAPASGKFIVQAKHTSSPVASCSGSDFETKLIDKETPKIKRMFDEGSLTHYLISLIVGKLEVPRIVSRNV